MPLLCKRILAKHKQKNLAVLILFYIISFCYRLTIKASAIAYFPLAIIGSLMATDKEAVYKTNKEDRVIKIIKSIFSWGFIFITALIFIGILGFQQDWLIKISPKSLYDFLQNNLKFMEFSTELKPYLEMILISLPLTLIAMVLFFILSLLLGCLLFYIIFPLAGYE